MSVVRDSELLEAHILSELTQHAQGRVRAITADNLAKKVGVPERAVRRCITSLRLQGELIASSVEVPAGYYVPETRAEARVCSAHLWSRVREIAAVARAFDQAASAFGRQRSREQQIALIFEDGPEDGGPAAGRPSA